MSAVARALRRRMRLTHRPFHFVEEVFGTYSFT